MTPLQGLWWERPCAALRAPCPGEDDGHPGKHGAVRLVLLVQGPLNPKRSIRKAWVLKDEEEFSLAGPCLAEGVALARRDSHQRKRPSEGSM